MILESLPESQIIWLSQHLRKVKTNHFHIRHLLHRVFNSLSTKTRFFNSAIRHMVSPVGADVVNHHSPYFKLFNGCEGLLDIFGENPGLEATSEAKGECMV